MAVRIRTREFHDPMGRARRVRAWFWRISIVLLLGTAVAGGVWGISRIPHHAAALSTPTPLHAIGTWCRKEGCQFFDANGTRWGTALNSSGPLLLLVRDERTDDEADPKMFGGMMAAIGGLPPLGLAVKEVTLPDDEPGGISITTTRGYDVYMDALGDISDQLATFAVFLSDRAKTPTFSPAYIDLRTPGRVYYK